VLPLGVRIKRVSKPLPRHPLPRHPLPRHPLSRYAARFSIAAPMAAFLTSCLARTAAGDNYGAALGGWLNIVVGCVMTLLILAGLALGVIGLTGGEKTSDAETRILSLIGITLNVSAVMLTALAIWIVWSR
jgi:hypothetical protein